MQLNEIEALIQLLDDPDEGVYSHVRERLMERGAVVLPILERHRDEGQWEEEHASRMDEILHGMRLGRLQEQTLSWVFGDEHNPVDAAMIVHEAVSPKVKSDGIRVAFEQIRKAIWIELNEDMTGFERLQVLNHMLFDVMGFGRASGATLKPSHALLGEVIDRKQGNALGLGFLYWSLARALELEVQLVDSQDHFLLCFCDASKLPSEREPDGAVIFYIDPFSKGEFIAKEQIHSWLGSPDTRSIVPVAPAEGLERLINFVSLALLREERHFLAKQLDELTVGWGRQDTEEFED
jgi:hypothetical protein